MTTNSFDNLRRDALKAKAIARHHRVSKNTDEYIRLLNRALASR